MDIEYTYDADKDILIARVTGTYIIWVCFKQVENISGDQR